MWSASHCMYCPLVMVDLLVASTLRDGGLVLGRDKLRLEAYSVERESRGTVGWVQQ